MAELSPFHGACDPRMVVDCYSNHLHLGTLHSTACYPACTNAFTMYALGSCCMIPSDPAISSLVLDDELKILAVV